MQVQLKRFRILFIIFFFSGCIENTTKEKKIENKKETIRLVVKIIKYLPETLHLQFEGEPDEWYDGTQIRIIKPKKYQQNLVIYHSEPQKSDSPWKNVGDLYEIELPEKYLNPQKGISYEIYSDTIDIIKLNEH